MKKERCGFVVIRVGERAGPPWKGSLGMENNQADEVDCSSMDYVYNELKELERPNSKIDSFYYEVDIDWKNCGLHLLKVFI